MENTFLFRVAGHELSLSFAKEQGNSMELLPSFKPFAISQLTAEPLFSLHIDDDLRPISKEHRSRIRTFDTGNGDTIVDRLDNGGYQYIVKDIDGNECCMLQTDSDFHQCHCALKGNYNMRCFGLNNALMLTFAFSSVRHHTLLVHASLVRCEGKGYAFIAKSGTGKSTQVSNWLRYIPNCDLMNDDNPIIRVEGDAVNIYGSPWSGKTPCYRNVSAPLAAITHIDRAKSNSVEREDAFKALPYMMSSVSSMKWDEKLYDLTIDTIGKVLERVPVYTLHCLPDKESAIVCNQTIAKNQ